MTTDRRAVHSRRSAAHDSGANGRGAHVEIHVETQLNDAWGVVKVRCIDAASEPEMALYGVELTCGIRGGP